MINLCFLIPPYHPGLSKIPARVGGPGSGILNLGVKIGGQKAVQDG